MKGTVKNPIVCWLLTCITCGLYGMFHIYSINGELKDYLDKSDNEVNPSKDLIISLLCGFYYYFWIFKTGKLIHEARVKAGVVNAKDSSLVYALLHAPICFQVGVYKLQLDLNKAWEA